MSYDPKLGRYCDECRGGIKKAHRTFENQDYCASCYPKIFVKKTCVRCSGSARIHCRAQGEALCLTCTKKDRICIRCTKPVPVAAKISNGKPVCASCARYFCEKRHCAECGKLSSWLSSMPSIGIQHAICENCRNKYTHKTCSVCRKYRKVKGFDKSGNAYCTACQPGEEQTHQCPKCGVNIAGSGSSRCRGCANFDAIENEGEIAATLMSCDWIKPLVKDFANWLHQRHPDSPILLHLYRSHQSFFERLGAQFALQDAATGEAILKFFGAAGLRKHLLATEFLSEKLNLEFTSELKKYTSERDQINKKLRQCREQTWVEIIDRYYGWLCESELPIRTVRLYLNTAVRFCETIQMKNQAWESSVLKTVLQQQPGIRNNLSKFVGHCRRAYGWDVSMPPRERQAQTGDDKNKAVNAVPTLLQPVKPVSREGLELDS